MSNVLRNNLSKNYKNRKNIFGFDVETFQTKIKYKDNSFYIKQDFLMGSVVGNGLKEVFWDQKEMADFLIHDKRLQDSKIFATNLEFDFTHVFQYTEYEDKFNRVIRDGLIYARYKESKFHKREFLDTQNFTGRVSVESMGEQLKLPKFNYPFKMDDDTSVYRKPNNEQEKEALEDYNTRDSYVTYMYAEKLRDFFNLLGCKMKITIASTGNDYWRRYFQPFQLYQESKKILEKHFLGSFHGGRTEVFKRGYFENCYYYDYNSHYPGVCNEGIDGKGNYPNPNSSCHTEKMNLDLLMKYEGITFVKIYCPYMYIPIIGVSMDQHYIFPTGTFSGWFTNIELRKCLKNGYEILEYGEGIYYTELFIPFRGIVLDLYNRRLGFKESGDILFSNMTKTMMNGGVFGKFGERITNKESVVHKNNVFCENGELYIKRGFKKVFLQKEIIRGEYIYYKEDLEETKIPKHVFPILASYTTALARIKLWDNISKIPEDLIYVDTDSIICKRRLFDDSSKLGELKLENIVLQMIMICGKAYYFKDNIGFDNFKYKGVGKKFIKNKEAFDKLIKDRRVVTNRFTKLKESAVRKIPFSSIIEVPKKLNLNDTKRKWVGDFSPNREDDSMPWRLEDGKLI